MDQLDPTISDEEMLNQGGSEAPPPDDSTNVEPEVEMTQEEKLGVPDEIAKAIVDICFACDQEDLNARNVMMMTWKKYEMYWRGIQAFYNSVAHDWQVPNAEMLSELGIPADAYTRVLNVTKPYGESIVAALSSSLPSITYLPDDAEVDEDVATAKAYSKIEELINRHNSSPLLFMKAIWLLYKEGLVFAHNYNREDSKYGTYKAQNKVNKTRDVHNVSCPECAGSVQMHSLPPEVSGGKEIQCPNCQQQMLPEVETNQELFEEIQEVDKPKTRECIDVYGPLYIKVPWSAKKQEDFGYLSRRFEQDKALLMEIYHEFADDIEKVGTAEYLDYERFARQGVEIQGEILSNQLTCRQTWLRPWKYNILGGGQRDLINALKKLFPDGCCATIVGNSLLVEVTSEKLDEHWTTSIHPLSSNVHVDAMVTSLIPIQDAQTDIFNLGIQTIEQGIPETFADPAVLDFDKYKNEEATPGMLYAATPPPGKTMSDSFYTLKSASLSEEYSVFKGNLDKAGEFVTGAFPSVYGGEQEGGKTLGEYRESRGQALQRLGITWQVLSYWWSELMSKSTISFARHMGTDEKIVKQNGTGYVNTWIRRVELDGKVGGVQPETSNQLPSTWSQQRDLIFQLMNMKSPEISSMLMHPNNTPVLRKIGGLTDLYIPGEDSRNKQYAEFIDLLNGVDVQVLETDDHQIELITCKSFLNSGTGLTYKKLQPQGFQKIMAHYQQHMQFLGTLTGQAQPNSQPGQEPQSESNLK